MSKIKITFLIFVLVSILDIIGVIFKIPTLIVVFKPLILLSLVVLYIVSSSERNKIYILALICSFLGDVFLIFEGEFYFIAGLLSFLIAHLLFIRIVVKRLQKNLYSKIVVSIIPFLTFYLVLIFTLKNSLGELLIPEIIYGLTIAVFGMVSLIDYLNTKSIKSLYILIGAVIFMFSDAILAVNRFYKSEHTLEVLVMITYVFAQYLIYKSMIQKKENKV